MVALGLARAGSSIEDLFDNQRVKERRRYIELCGLVYFVTVIQLPPHLLGNILNLEWTKRPRTLARISCALSLSLCNAFDQPNSLVTLLLLFNLIN